MRRLEGIAGTLQVAGGIDRRNSIVRDHLALRRHVGGPGDRERLSSVDQFHQRPVASLRYLPDDACSIGIPHLYWIDRRSLSLFRGGICKANSSSPHIPEITSVEVALGR